MNEQSLTQEQKQEVVNRLQQRQFKGVCPMCSHTQFTIADGYFNQTIQTHFMGLILGGTSIPTIAVICTRCGFTSQHALGVLGLLPDAHEEVKK